MRRSARAAKTKAIAHRLRKSEDDENDDEEEEEEEEEAASYEVDGIEEESLNGDDSSADEWKPEKDSKKGKRGRAVVEVDESDEDEGELPEVEDDEGDLEIAGRINNGKSKASKTKERKRAKIDGSLKPAKSTSSTQTVRRGNVIDDEEIMAIDATLEAEEEAYRLETEAAKVEAAQKWEEFRKRKEINDQAKVKTSNGVLTAKDHTAKDKKAAPESITTWLGIADPEWPTTCDDAMIIDRDSLFVGYVYTLTTPSLSTITQMLSHLGKVVHPKTVPTDKLPPSMRHLPTHRRGAMHDMHAWRCLALKIGRTGLNGPDDFGLEEGAEDDGEKYGAQKITRAIKQLGATDVLVIVSRWYGGTLLGPVRFQHIENCARAALAKYMINEAIIPLKEQLKRFDEEMNSLRLKIDPTVGIHEIQYDNLEYDKAERLITARKKGIEMLQKRLNAKEASEKEAEANVSEVIPKAATTRITELNISEDQLAEQEISQADKQGLFIDNEPPVPIEEEEDLGDLTGWDALAN